MTGDNWRFLAPKLRTLVRRSGFTAPTPVQEACLPPALAGESFVAVAPTGTGKTLVYLLPVLKAYSPGRNLVLVPTRELGYQVSQMLQALSPDSREGIVLGLGGHDIQAQRRSLRRKWHTLIATPGRLLDLLESSPRLLHDLRLLVLDEFDRLIDLGFEEQIRTVLDHVSHRRQTLLFSATGAEDALERLPLGNPKRVRITDGKSTPLTERFYFLKSNRKKNDLLLEALTGNPGRTLVFVANREKANHLNGLLRLRGFRSQSLHGDRLQRERAKAYQEFREGVVPVLVATDLAARGLDIPEVDLVVNYDLPRNFRDYVHRSGRTARRSRPGVCISFAGPDDFLALLQLEKGFGGPLPVHPGYARRDLWLEQARRAHSLKARTLAGARFIRREQGIASHSPD